MVLVQGPAPRNSRVFCLEDDEQDVQVDSEAQEKEEGEVKYSWVGQIRNYFYPIPPKVELRPLLESTLWYCISFTEQTFFRHFLCQLP